MFFNISFLLIALSTRKCDMNTSKWIIPLKPKLVYITFKNSVRTARKTPHFTIAKISWLTLFKEINAVYSDESYKTN
jgi:hypothetical protein